MYEVNGGLTCLATCYQDELVPKHIFCYAINRYCSLLFTTASLLFLHVECSANRNSGEYPLQPNV